MHLWLHRVFRSEALQVCYTHFVLPDAKVSIPTLIWRSQTLCAKAVYLLLDRDHFQLLNAKQLSRGAKNDDNMQYYNTSK